VNSKQKCPKRRNNSTVPYKVHSLPSVLITLYDSNYFYHLQSMFYVYVYTYQEDQKNQTILKVCSYVDMEKRFMCLNVQTGVRLAF